MDWHIFNSASFGLIFGIFFSYFLNAEIFNPFSRKELGMGYCIAEFLWLLSHVVLSGVLLAAHTFYKII